MLKPHYTKINLVVPYHLCLRTSAGLQRLGQDGTGDLDESGLPRDHLLATAGVCPATAGPQPLLATWLWWAMRLLTLQQRLVSGLSSSLRFALTTIAPKVPALETLKPKT